MKCRRVPGAGGHRLRRHNADFCRRLLPARTAASRCARAIDDFDMIGPGERVLVAVSGRQGLAGPVGHPARPRLRGRRPLPRASASASTATRRATLRPGLRRPARGLTLIEVDLPDDVRLRHPDRRPRPPSGCRARRAGCRSATCSTRPRSTAATTWSPPATTSTTRRRCCSATCCAGTTDYLGRQLPVLPGRPTASPARSSRWSGWASGRWRPTACCAASTTSSRSARWRSATSTSATRRRSTPSRTQSPGAKAAFYFGFLDRASRAASAGGAEAERERPAAVRRRAASPTTGEVCAFCQLVDAGRREPVAR